MKMNLAPLAPLIALMMYVVMFKSVNLLRKFKTYLRAKFRRRVA